MMSGVRHWLLILTLALVAPGLFAAPLQCAEDGSTTQGDAEKPKDGKEKPKDGKGGGDEPDCD